MRGLFFVLSLLILNTGCKKTDSRYNIVYINSYHQGYPPSDAVMGTMMRHLPADTFHIITFFMDTKRKSDSLSVSSVVNEILRSVSSINPDLIIVSDDAALKYVVSPHQDEIHVPVVYCCVNWSSSSYSLAKAGITGMIEVLPIREVLSFLKEQDPGLTSLAVLSENSVSEKQNSLLLDTLYKSKGFEPEYFLVDNFNDWKKTFMKLNESTDVIYLPTNGGISGWDDREAKQWVQRHIKVPVFTCDDFMMPYAAVGFTKVAGEQGEYVARTARRILQKKISITEMREEKNKRFVTWINTTNLEKTNLIISDSLMARATTTQ